MRVTRHLLPAVAWGIGVAILVTLPLPLVVMEGAVPGHPTGDLADHLQGAWAVAEALRAGTRPDITGPTHFPGTLRLWFADPIGALVALPLWHLGPAAAWGSVLFLQVAAGSGAGFLAGRDLSGTHAGGATTAVVVGASPYMLGLLHSGLSEYVGIAPAIGGMWALIRLTGRDPRAREAPAGAWIWTGACIALATVQAPYYGFFLGLAALACLLGPGWRTRVRPVAQALGLGAALCTPVLLLLADALGDPESAITTVNAPAWNQGGWPLVDGLGWFIPGHLFPDTPRLGNPGVLQVHRLSLAAVAAGIIAAARPTSAAPAVRRLLLPLGLMLLLGLGPILTLDGQPVQLAGRSVPLPLSMLYVLDTPLRMIHHPYRIAGVVLPMLGMLAAVGTRALPRPVRFIVPAIILADGLLGGPTPWPLVTADVQPAPILADLPPGPVLEWPPDATAANRAYQLAQPAHGRPIPYGVNIFVHDALRGDPLVEDLLTAFDDIGTRGRNRDVPGPPLAPVAPQPGATRLAAMGFSALVLYPHRLGDRERAKTLRHLRRHLGEPDVEVPSGLAWILSQ